MAIVEEEQYLFITFNFQVRNYNHFGEMIFKGSILEWWDWRISEDTEHYRLIHAERITRQAYFSIFMYQEDGIDEDGNGYSINNLPNFSILTRDARNCCD